MEILTDLTTGTKILICIMPRNFATHWNSTYNMLKFACTYHKAIDKIMSEWSLKLCNYELSEQEWEIVKDLHNSLKVSTTWHCLNFKS